MLTEIEKDQLRVVIMSGLFGVVNPKVLASVATMSDEEVRAKILEYKQKRIPVLISQKELLDVEINKFK